MRALVCARVRDVVHSYRRAFSCVRVCVYVCVHVLNACACAAVWGPLTARRGLAVFIARPVAPRRVLSVRLVPSDGCARVAAGVSWASRTTSAPWAARCCHTTVIDAAGAIYVIGGLGSTVFGDVWASTDGGARPDSVGGSGGTLGGYYRGTAGGTRATAGGTRGYLGGY